MIVSGASRQGGEGKMHRAKGKMNGRPHLRCPQQTNKHQHRQTILLLRLLHYRRRQQHHKHDQDPHQREHGRAEQPRRTPDSANRRLQLLGGHLLGVVALQPRFRRIVVVPEQGSPDPHVCRLRLALDANHLAPDGIPLPDDVFAQVQAQLLFRRDDVAFGDDVGIGLFDEGNLLLYLAHGLGPKGIRRVHGSVHVACAQLAIQGLVVLFQGFGEARLVELDEGLELAERDVQRDGALLERDAGIVEHGAHHAVAVVFVGLTRSPRSSGQLP